jgi:uncharacterized membrane protein HdeD (DUF308 family)
MNKPTTFYAILALGVIALIAGVVLLMMKHHISSYAGIAAGVVLIVVGIAGAVMNKPKLIAQPEAQIQAAVS